MFNNENDPLPSSRFNLPRATEKELAFNDVPFIVIFGHVLWMNAWHLAGFEMLVDASFARDD
jgi:hypothetical protein